MNPEEIRPEVTADWARQQAETLMSEKAKTDLNDLNEVLSAISKAASEKKRVLHTLPYPAGGPVVKELMRRGFKLEFINAITRESSYWSIVW